MAELRTDSEEMKLMTELQVYASQLERAADGATFVKDGFVRVKDPEFLVGLLANAADTLGRMIVKDEEAADTIASLVAERDRCHARLEIDHYWRIGENDDQDLERVDLPLEERATFPDGIEARNATIALLEEDIKEARQRIDALMLERANLIATKAEQLVALTKRAQAAEASLAQMREALKPFADYCDELNGFLDYHNNPLPDDDGPGWVYVKIGDFRRARAALQSEGAKP